MDGIRTLMYGWEFPPKISGGLGVACYAIVRELIKQRTNLTLVLPFALPTNDIEQLKLVNGGDKTNSINNTNSSSQLEIKSPAVSTSLHPYAKGMTRRLSEESVGDFLNLVSQLALPDEIKGLAKITINEQQLTLDDHYENSLLTEVFRYASFAGRFGIEVTHDVIHAHDWLTVLAALEAKGRSGKPVVLHIHALETDRSGFWVDKNIYAIEKYGMKYVDRIIAVSQFTKDNIVRHYGIDPNKIIVVHNGIDKQPVQPCSEQRPHRMVLFLGRITHQKGPWFFIEAAKKVLEKRQDVQFVLAGTGDSLTTMIERVAEYRIGKNVHFTGFLSPTKVQQIYGLADVYVMPSVSEPFGLSALEALSSGIPAVISKQSGAAEVLNHTLAADFWDTDDIAAKILALLDYGALRETTLLHSRSEIDSLTWEKAAGEIIKVYESVLN
jgi:glycosyltransferase involved in cell wall biosynthesis